jgi:cytochrome c553
MRSYLGLLIAITIGIGSAVVAGQVAVGPAQGPPPWAYGFAMPGPDPVAPPCPPDAKAHDCSRPGAPWKADGIALRLDDTDRIYSIVHVQAHYDPADWYPQEHPVPPSIVQYGRQAEKIRACAHCHYHNGMGKSENAHLAGLPKKYFVDQIALMKSGGRKGADPRKANMNEMVQIARLLTDAEITAAADYYASMKWRPWVKVVETDTVPKTRVSAAGLFLQLDGNETEPLGQRIIEVPEFRDRTERQRDPRAGFIAYVLPGSVARGKTLVETGGGKTTQCAACHGPDLQGRGDVPGIADRTASYNMRQLYNYQAGTRKSTLMQPIVSKLSVDDMTAIVAYLASL